VKTGISGLDLHFLVKEFKILEGGKLQKVIQGEDFLSQGIPKHKGIVAEHIPEK